MAVTPIDVARQVLEALVNDYAGMRECDDGLTQDWAALLEETWRSHGLYDRQLYAHMTRRLASLGDPSLRFLPGTNSSFAPLACGFDTHRHGDALYVTRVREDERMRLGDAIVSLGSMGPDEYLAQALGNPVSEKDPERQRWDDVLCDLSRVVVRHPDGTTRRVKLRTFPVAARRPDPCTLSAPGDSTLLLRVTQLDDGEAAQALSSGAERLARADRLVIDLRGCSGGAEVNAYPLLDCVFDEPTNLTEVQAPETVLTNYTEANCARRERQIAQLRVLAQGQGAGEGAGLLTWMDENLELVRANRGAGYVEETVRPDDVAIAAAPAGQSVVLLTDDGCADAAEWFVRVARQSARVTVVGRATRGSLDYSNPLAIAFEDRFVFVYPMSKSKAADEGRGMRGQGIAPDVVVPFTPEECTRDVILGRALRQ